MNLPASLREPPAPRGGRNHLIMIVTLICNRKQTFGWLSHQGVATQRLRSEEHTSELQSLMRISYAVFCLKKKKIKQTPNIQQKLQLSEFTTKIITQITITTGITN